MAVTTGAFGGAELLRGLEVPVGHFSFWRLNAETRTEKHDKNCLRKVGIPEADRVPWRSLPNVIGIGAGCGGVKERSYNQ